MQVAEAVQHGAADIGFVEGRIEAENLMQQAIARDRIIIVASPKHLASKRRISASDLPSLDWVLREPGSGTRSEFDDALKRWKLSIGQLNVVLELPSNEAVRMAVEAGAGATAISELVAARGIALGKLKAIPLQLPERAFTALRHRERYLSKAARAFLDEIKGKSAN